MRAIVHDPSDTLYATTPDYVHALEVRGATRTLFVSGTMGLDPDGTAPPSLDAQLARVWANIAAILEAADMTLDHVVRVTSYLRHAGDAEVNATARRTALGGRAVPTTAIVVGHLADEWLVEIEVIAAA